MNKMKAFIWATIIVVFVSTLIAVVGTSIARAAINEPPARPIAVVKCDESARGCINLTVDEIEYLFEYYYKKGVVDAVKRRYHDA